MSRFEEDLNRLALTGNLRSLDRPECEGVADFTSNDYLGIAARNDLRECFFSRYEPKDLLMTSSASRLLASVQKPYARFERLLRELYGRDSLLFNSGYHANSGIIPAIADKHTIILADRLVHASIIDGIILSRAPFKRFRHNDFDALEKMIDECDDRFETILVVVESVYSMDGDSAAIDRLIEIKRRHVKVMLYVDEAHAFGVCGPAGLGLVAASSAPREVDLVMCTLGKAAGSEGAFIIANRDVREYLVNHARSLIFSTSLAPIHAMWGEYVVSEITGMDEERRYLRGLCNKVADVIADAVGAPVAPSHILPLIVGDSKKAALLSKLMLADGVKVLPIRVPTVPAGTERLRFSISASMTDDDVEKLKQILKHNYEIVMA